MISVLVDARMAVSAMREEGSGGSSVESVNERSEEDTEPMDKKVVSVDCLHCCLPILSLSDFLRICPILVIREIWLKSGKPEFKMRERERVREKHHPVVAGQDSSRFQSRLAPKVNTDKKGGILDSNVQAKSG